MKSADLGWLAAFVAGLILVLGASDQLVGAVEAAGDRYGWRPGLVGLLAAAGADGPEVSASILSLLAGAHDVGLGVILGSNLFNLAALLGLPILLVGRVAVGRFGLLLNGPTMILTGVLAASLVLGALPIRIIEPLVFLVLAAYAALLALPRERALAYIPSFLDVASPDADDLEREERGREREADIAQGFPTGRHLALRGMAATALVIAGCDVLVNATLYLGPRAGIPSSLTGTFGLAALTSLPNVWVAISLARRGRGAVLVSTVCNSNTINAVFGICVPAPLVSLRAPAIVRGLDIPALAALSLVSVALVWRGHGLGRKGALALVLAYLAFAAARLALTH